MQNNIVFENIKLLNYLYVIIFAKKYKIVNVKLF